ncbi:hypothetical protein E2C01_036618 [Portunus trituberculatus]|uniref:Uncharacterized protein n=1 Tax=Portunus trituberculatus TaxID=210409 RepID=A0A5B7FCY9_PORTR|nr:hypothetical protein [Portunus trituberculatus]
MRRYCPESQRLGHEQPLPHFIPSFFPSQYPPPSPPPPPDSTSSSNLGTGMRGAAVTSLS